MTKAACPRCASQTDDTPLFQCVRCFTVYCRKCTNTNEGRLCPQCRMSARLVLSPEK